MSSKVAGEQPINDKRFSVRTTKNFLNGKGELDQVGRLLQRYDTNRDGTFDNQEVRAILAEKEDASGVYTCPVYKQTERARGPYGFVFAMQLKTKQPPSKWTMAGVAMLLAID